MIQYEKYRRLALKLNGEGSLRSFQDEAGFYFRQLEKLEIDLLVAQIEVSEQERQIAALEGKIGSVQAEHQKPDSQNRRMGESSSEQIVKEWVCPLKDCGKQFQKQSDLCLHNRVAHSVDRSWLRPSLFRYELQQ